MKTRLLFTGWMTACTFLITQVTTATTYFLQPPTTAQDTLDRTSLSEITLEATRVNAESPITHTDLTEEDLEPRNLGQDLPILLNYLPNVVTTSDAGAGIGYTGIRVRGSDATRVNVTINGVPYNDAESQGTFWVNMPDFATSVESLQLQRGVGTSTNGSAAFGASLNLKTTDYSLDPKVEVGNSFGSFDSRRHNIQFTTGLLDDRWEFHGRASQIKSDGYVDRATSDLKSYYVSGSYVGEDDLVKLLVFGGDQETYQAYYGVDRMTLQNDRTYNPAGAYVDSNGEQQFYNNQVDRYKQDHYQLIYNHRFNDAFTSGVTLHYTKGRGYFQEYIESDSYFNAAGRSMFDFYGLEPFMSMGETVTSSDLETRRWLDNEFYGVVSHLDYTTDWINASFGTSYNHYDGDHYGEIISGEFIRQEEPLQRFYMGNSDKYDVNAFAKANFDITQKLNAYVDLQQRYVTYETTGTNFGNNPFLVDVEYSFFNPKAGAVYKFNTAHSLYASVARGQREPNRSDFENGDPEPEDLIDYELGYRLKKQSWNLNANLYYMDYKDQLVLTGQIDDQGTPIRANSGESYRLGLEVDARVKLSDRFFLQPNFSISENRNEDFFITTEDGVESLGSTEIAYSPGIVAGNAFTYKPINNLEFSILSKYVGDQQLDNTDRELASLDSFFVNDLNAQYVWKPTDLVEEISLKLLVNNFLDEEYANNGYVFPGSGAFLFPQAGINFLIGAHVTF